MCVTRGLTRNCPQAEALRRVVSRGFETSIVKGEAFGLAIFEKQFAIVRAMKSGIHDGFDALTVHAGLGEEQIVRAGHRGSSRGSEWYIGEGLQCATQGKATIRCAKLNAW